MMKKLFMRIFKGLSVFLSFIFRLLQPFFKIANRLVLLAKIQSKVKFPVPVSSQFDGELQIIGTAKVSWGEQCRFGKDVVLETQGEGVIELGNNVRINQGTVIVAHSQVSIADDCLIGEYCSIRDANHEIRTGELIRTQGHSTSAIKIENDCWLGRGAVILKGVTLHQGCVIGANSVVTKTVFNNAIAVGIPAKELKKRKI